ncbi:amino acid adenylation domain-containing protein [Kitasatospora sp. NPDC096140]|uniref:amino acid adenylation domain-containing protein n=1 Tax=Kitasatospora sp. NPDC096140 TaxID=3155425 RepID=UPI00332B5D67
MTDRTLHDWFVGSTARWGEAVALEVDGQSLTYRQLDQEADRIARVVLAGGEIAPRRVGLYAARSVLAYAGYLAALRLGATVVPLNPSFPAARNERIVRAAGLDVVIAQDTDPGLPAPVRGVGSLPALPAAAPPDRLPAGAGRRSDPEEAAYILFTSGSTGAPKGVPVAHRNVDVYLRHVIPRYRLEPGARLTQNFDLTFDLSVFDLFAAWGSGATLVVPTRGELLSPAKFVSSRGITHWFSVPSVITVAQRLGRLGENSMPGLRWSLFCGEPLTVEQARAWQRAAPGSTVENLYGPTELTLSCAQFRLPTDCTGWPETANGTVPVGELYPGLEALVLGEDGRPAATGELCVRGAQRFAGYLDPSDNRGRFVTLDSTGASMWDRSAPPPGEAWYRTGDRVRDENGCLVHLGRLDDQVKVQGYRVELGEIEAVLRGHPRVAEAVVVAIREDGGPVVLHAVCVGDGDGDGDGHNEELLALLRARLPQHMVPRSVVFRPRLPLNPNGKVDRNAIRTAVAGA